MIVVPAPPESSDPAKQGSAGFDASTRESFEAAKKVFGSYGVVSASGNYASVVVSGSSYNAVRAALLSINGVTLRYYDSGDSDTVMIIVTLN